MPYARCRAAGTDHGDVVGHHPLDAGPRAHDVGAAEAWKELHRRPRIECELLEVEHRAVGIEIGASALTAADHYGAVCVLLERERSPGGAHHGLDERRDRRGDGEHQPGGDHRYRLSQLLCDAAGPRACGVNDRRRLESAGVADDAPDAVVPRQRIRPCAFVETNAQALGFALESESRSKGQSRAIFSADNAPDAMGRERRQVLAQFLRPDDRFMMEAERLQFSHARFQPVELGVVLCDLDLPGTLEATRVVHQVFDALPEFERSHRKRHFREMPSQPPHAARVHARGMTCNVVLLEHDHLHAGPRQMQRRRAAVEAAADDNDVGRLHFSAAG